MGFVGHIPIKVYGSGILIRGEVRTVSSGSPGQLDQWLVRTGDAVEAGQVVATVGQPGLRLEIENTEEELATLERQTTKQGVSTRRLLAQLQARRRALVAPPTA